MTQRLIKVGIRGGESQTQAKARFLLDYDAVRPPEGGPAEAGGLMASSLLCWAVREPAGVRE